MAAAIRLARDVITNEGGSNEQLGDADSVLGLAEAEAERLYDLLQQSPSTTKEVAHG